MNDLEKKDTTRWVPVTKLKPGMICEGKDGEPTRVTGTKRLTSNVTQVFFDSGRNIYGHDMDLKVLG